MAGKTLNAVDERIRQIALAYSRVPFSGNAGDEFSVRLELAEKILNALDEANEQTWGRNG